MDQETKYGCGIKEDVLYYGKRSGYSCKKGGSLREALSAVYENGYACRQASIASEEGDKQTWKRKLRV